MKTKMICALTLFALASITRAVDPPPDGGYPGGNTAEGDNALFSLTTGQFNTAIGNDALYSNTTGGANTAAGYQSLSSDTTGGANTATGVQALYSNTTGGANTAEGDGALYSNTTGLGNTATGVQALENNTTGSFNTAVGTEALEGTFNSHGSNNTALGFAAMYRNRGGDFNTATGEIALNRNSSGNYNTANGVNALARNTTGSNNIALGAFAGFHLTIGDNNIDIGNRGVTDESNTIRIGTKGTQHATFIAGIHGTTTVNMNAVPVVIDSEGQLGTVSSSARFKDEIKPMDKASETILGLKPVTFHYKSDNTGTAQFGLIAEEVAKANPDLVVRDEKGEIYTVRYDAVNAMLLNEFLKEHRKVQQLEATTARQEAILAQQQNDFQAAIARQQKQFEVLTAGLKQQATQIENVSEQLKINKSAPELVAENH